MFKKINLETPIVGPVVFEPTIYKDSRGEFFETYKAGDLESFGIKEKFVQENQSTSTLGVLRGMHYQHTNPQAKLIRVVYGCIYDVVIDLRANAPTCGKWVSTILDDKLNRSFFVPAGFAHGFLTLSDRATIVYKCSDYYNVHAEKGLLWNDPKIGIDWCLDAFGIIPMLSEKDRAWATL